MSPFLPLERPALYSPAWFVPFDEFRQRVNNVGVTVALDRLEDDGTWSPLDAPAVRTPSAAIAYPGLGRRAEAWTGVARRHRARFAALGHVPLYPADDEPFSAALVGVEFLVHPYDATTAPAVPTAPRLVRLLPAASFPYPPGTRVVRGVVVDAVSRAPLANTLVQARGQTSRRPWQERTLTDANGAFRLSLRWEGVVPDPGETEEVFTVEATQETGRTGSLTVRLPQDADRRHVIEVRDQ